MSRYNSKYKYEVHFPHNKEIFYSDVEIQEFVKHLRSEDGLENVNGDMVYITIPVSVTYIKQIPSNKKF